MQLGKSVFWARAWCGDLCCDVVHVVVRLDIAHFWCSSCSATCCVSSVSPHKGATHRCIHPPFALAQDLWDHLKLKPPQCDSYEAACAAVADIEAAEAAAAAKGLAPIEEESDREDGEEGGEGGSDGGSDAEGEEGGSQAEGEEEDEEAR